MFNQNELDFEIGLRETALKWAGTVCHGTGKSAEEVLTLAKKFEEYLDSVTMEQVIARRAMRKQYFEHVQADDLMDDLKVSNITDDMKNAYAMAGYNDEEFKALSLEDKVKVIRTRQPLFEGTVQ